MDKFFSLFGKIVGILLIAGGLIGAGIYLGQKYKSPQVSTQPSPTQMVSVSPTPASSSGVLQSQKTIGVHVTVTSGGVYTFDKYMLSAFSDWTVTKNQDNGTDKLVIAKGDYSITILQGPIDGGACYFPGETPQGMGIALTNPVATIPLLTGDILKRGQADSQTNPGKETDQICGQGKLGNNQYGTFTQFGVITYITPLTRDADTLAQMDAMVGSLQKQ